MATPTHYSKRTLWIGLIVLVLILAGTGIWLRSSAPSTPKSFIEQLSDVDLELRADIYFPTCTHPVQKYWGGIEKKLQTRLTEGSLTEELADTFLDDLFNFYAFNSTLPGVEQTIYQGELMDRYQEVMKVAFGEQNLTRLTLDRGVEVFADEVAVYREAAPEHLLAEQSDAALIEAFMYGQGFMLYDMIMDATTLSSEEQAGYLNVLAEPLGVSWEELRTVLAKAYFGDTYVADMKLPVDISHTSYELWMQRVVTPLAHTVAAGYQGMELALTESPWLREYYTGKMYHPVPYQESDGELYRVFRLCHTPLDTEDGVETERERLIKVLGASTLQGDDSPMQWIETKRLEEPLAELATLSAAERQSSPAWTFVAAMYKDDTAHKGDKTEEARALRRQFIENSFTTTLQQDPALLLQ